MLGLKQISGHHVPSKITATLPEDGAYCLDNSSEGDVRWYKVVEVSPDAKSTKSAINSDKLRFFK